MDLLKTTQSCVHQEVLGANIQLEQEVREQISLWFLRRDVARLGAKSSCSMSLLEILRMGRTRPSFLLELYKYLCSKFLTFVPALKMAPRAPFGPSEVLKAGMFFDGIAVDLQWSAALRRET